MSEPNIPGGYIILARKIIESDIMKKPPMYLKVWTWLLLQAQHKDFNGLKRGQIRTSITEIQEAMTYYVGFRKIVPSKKEIWGIIQYLRFPYEGNDEGNSNSSMMVTMKVTHGMVITIGNYGFYQDSKNYEGNNEGNSDLPMKVTPKVTAREQYIQECNKKDNKKNNIGDKSPDEKNNSKTDSRVKEFIDYYSQTFQKKFGFKPVISGAKDGGIVKELLKTFELEKLKELLGLYLESKDQFLIDNGYSLVLFRNKINGLLVGQNKSRPGETPRPKYTKDKHIENPIIQPEHVPAYLDAEGRLVLIDGPDD